MRRSVLSFLASGTAALVGTPLSPQTPAPPEPPPVQREFRAAWVATVSNIDWPSTPDLNTWDQQQELLAILNKAVALRLNAIILQIRPGTDALYQSTYEPWSEYLTGRQGRAPEPVWDPLAYAVTEAHKRGLELHAWFNPYRARYARPLGEAAKTHITKTRPDLVKPYGRYMWMDPGEPEVRRMAVRVVTDVVRRYDIDGVHIDDYFYPYRERDPNTGQEIDFPDGASYSRYVKGGGTMARDDWRRNNVDLLVEALYSAIHTTKPTVRFGVSPIGIWRPGNPPSVTPGFDAFQEIYSDTRKWLRSGWVDYWVPQLYWAIDSPQSYPVLLAWWAEQNVMKRNLWIGNGLHRVGDVNVVGANGNRAANWRADEIVEQVRLTRASLASAPNGGATGNIFFSMKGLIQNVDSIDDKLMPLYTEQALVPASRWLDRTPPPRPTIVVRPDRATGELAVVITPGQGERSWLWVVQCRSGDVWTTEIIPGTTRTHRLTVPEGMPVPDVVRVSAVDRVGNQGAAASARVPSGAGLRAAKP